MIVAAGTLLLAAVAGVMTAEAQSGKKGKPTKVSEVKKVEQVQKQFNATVNALRLMAKSRTGPAASEAIVVVISDKSAFKDALDTKQIIIVKGDKKGKKDKGNVTQLDQLVQMQTQVNGRFDAMKKSGQLTELDRKVLNARTLSDLQAAVGR
jgi:hypothetical protein